MARPIVRSAKNHGLDQFYATILATLCIKGLTLGASPDLTGLPRVIWEKAALRSVWNIPISAAGQLESLSVACGESWRHSLQIAPSRRGSGLFEYVSLGFTSVYNPKWISIGSAVFPQLTVVTNTDCTQIDVHITLMCDICRNRPHLCTSIQPRMDPLCSGGVRVGKISFQVVLTATRQGDRQPLWNEGKQ